MPASSWTFNMELQELTWQLPASKSDPMSLGTSRTWGCLCARAGLACPFHTARNHWSALKRHYQQLGLAWLGSRPLFPSASGTVVEKAAFVLTFEALATLVGQPTRSSTGARLLGGHTARVTGAQVLAAHGVEVSKLRILARHSGDTILRYVAEAPLAALRMDLGVPPVVVPSVPVREATTRKLGARLHSLEAAVARLTAAAPASVSEPAPLSSEDVFVENLNSLVLHRLRPGLHITICG